MKSRLKKWLLRLTVTTGLIVVLLLVIVLNPILTYANKTTHRSYAIFHHQPLHNSTFAHLDSVTQLVRRSEWFRDSLQIDVCFNDGSVYPDLMRTLRGPAFGWGFSNKVVLYGMADFASNTVELNGYKWNLTQLMAHELTHCLQFDALGFWGSNPVANLPEWKWEGYAEYVSRQGADQTDLQQNIRRLVEAENEAPGDWAIRFRDSTIAPRSYYRYWLMVQYWIDVKKRSYAHLLTDITPEAVLHQEMMTWYNKQKASVTGSASE